GAEGIEGEGQSEASTVHFPPQLCLYCLENLPDTVGEPLFWFLITQRKVLKGRDEGEYFVIGGYEGSSCLWHETDEGFAINLRQKIFGLDHGIGHFMIFEVDLEAQAPAPPIPKWL